MQWEAKLFEMLWFGTETQASPTSLQISWLLQVTMGTTATETLSVAGNIFVGQVSEARPGQLSTGRNMLWSCPKSCALGQEAAVALGVSQAFLQPLSLDSVQTEVYESLFSTPLRRHGPQGGLAPGLCPSGQASENLVLDIYPSKGSQGSTQPSSSPIPQFP